MQLMHSPVPARRAHLRRTAALAAVLALAACSGGGGGGGGVSPLPAPVPTPAPGPAPTPGPTPTPSASNTAEYQASVGPVSMNALIAYDRGATGANVRVGVIDSGIDLQSEEFGNCTSGIGTGTCRILASSRDTAGNGTIDDVGGHGTAVAFTLAGRRNGVGTHGVAFDGQLVVIRADRPGSCATEGEDEGCSFPDSAIAAGIDAARTAGARVINISLGGEGAGSSVLQAINRATAAGIIIVVAAGNDGEEPQGNNPDGFAVSLSSPSIARGLVIIAGSVGTGDVISDFSNRAGSQSNHYLTAVGERVRAPDANNTAFFWSGTSFSAPQIAGAVALLAQAFPTLTGTEIVQILYASARDAGAAGIDPVYGRGVLDLTKAFLPIGSMSLAGSRAPLAEYVNGQLSAAMGDAAQGPLSAVLLDGFDRAYVSDLARTINREGPARRLPALMASRERSFAVGTDQLSVSVTLVPAQGNAVHVERLALRQDDALRAQALAATVTGRLGSRAQFAVGASESGNTLTARLAGRRDPAFLVARDPAHSSGFDVDVGGSAAVRQQLGLWGLTVAQESGEVLSRRDSPFAALRGTWDRHGYARSTLAVDRAFGGLRIGLSATRLAEADTILGAHFTGGLGGARADSLFVDLGARAELGGGWELGGSLRQGWTFAELRGGVEGSGLIRTDGFAADIGKLGVLGRSDRIGFRFAQPLRVARGGIDLMLPAEWSYATESVSAWQAARINLAPRGRELDYELSYALPIWTGDISMNGFARRDPGHFAAFGTDYGGAVRLTLGF